MDLCEFETSLVYKVSSRTASTTQRNHVLKKRKKGLWSLAYLGKHDTQKKQRFPREVFIQERSEQEAYGRYGTHKNGRTDQGVGAGLRARQQALLPGVTLKIQSLTMFGRVQSGNQCKSSIRNGQWEVET